MQQLLDPFILTVKLFTKQLRSTFGRNVLWVIVGLSLRFGIQAVYFILVARTLKPEAYGLFAGIQALVMVFSPFATWGSGNILVKNVSREPETFPVQWGGALATTLLLGSFFVTVVFTISIWVYGIDIAYKVVMPAAIGDLLGMSLLSLSAFAYQAFERLSRTSVLWMLLALNRFLVIVLMMFLPLTKCIENWAFFYGISGITSGLIALLLVRRELGWGPLTFETIRNEWTQGFYFSIGMSAQGTYNDIDKTLMSRLSEAVSAGAYAAAYRIVDVFLIPNKSLFHTAYPRFFKEGKKGVKSAYHLAKQLLPWAIGWAVVAWVVLSTSAFIFPKLLGKEYELVSRMIAFLGPILIFKSAHYLAADALTGANFQGIRSFIQVAIALLNIGLNLWWIPNWGWRGAVVSSIISDGLLMVILWYILAIKSGRAL